MKDGLLQIAFVMPDMALGGAERALITLLKALKNKNVHVSLLLFNKKGQLLSDIPPWVEVKILHDAGNLDKLRGQISGILRRAGAKYLFDKLKKVYHQFGSKISQGKMKENTYDTIIAFKDGVATWYVAKSMNAKIKVAFIHTDFKNAGYNAGAEQKIYKEFDRIYCVSKKCRDSFVDMMPTFAYKTKVFINLVNPEEIRLLSKKGEKFKDNFNGIRILTVGRLSHEKGLDKALKVLVRLKAKGYIVRWYIIGDGYEKDILYRQAVNYGVDDDFVLMGEMKNPYGLMSSCDIYVQPSNYEGYCIAVAEARALYKPIVACNFAGAEEQLVDGKTGVITGMSVDSLYNGIIRLIKDSTLKKQIIENLKLGRFDENRQLIDFFSFITCRC